MHVRYISSFIFGLALILGQSSPAPTQVIRAEEYVKEETNEQENPTETWPMAAANPQRTSWNAAEVEVPGIGYVEWYRPIEAFIPMNAQLIAAHGLIYVPTARGLYALDAASGDLRWRFDTEMPLGNSPTVAGGVVYIPGYDKKVHALDAITGRHLWAFEGAEAGYAANPLVVDGKVILGSRDGNLYAIYADDQPKRGRLAWKYPTGGAILVSAAYQDGVVYFASEDQHAYAVKAANGSLVWRSGPLPGQGVPSYWPVIYQDKVFFVVGIPYKMNRGPGGDSVLDENGAPLRNIKTFQRHDLFFDKSEADPYLGPLTTLPDPWAKGKEVLDASRALEYYEDNPTPDPYLHKPWRRLVAVLDAADGSEYTLDWDQDGYREYAPFLFVGTTSGAIYPPIVNHETDTLYIQNVYCLDGDRGMRGQVMGWKPGTPFFTLEGADTAHDEPQAVSFGGSLLYRSRTLDRFASWRDLTTGESQVLWGYSEPLRKYAPGYNILWDYDPNRSTYYLGSYGGANGVYNNHGDQNPFIPYQGRIYIHRSNAVIAMGPRKDANISYPVQQPLLESKRVDDTVSPPGAAELIARLEAEILKFDVDGDGNLEFLRPGYYNDGHSVSWKHLREYFIYPGDTLYTLAAAYPYLSAPTQNKVKSYLQRHFRAYFATPEGEMYALMGYAEGYRREAGPAPPEVESDMKTIQKRKRPEDGFGFSGLGAPWEYPQNTWYAFWKYAQIVPEDGLKAYELAKSRLELTSQNSDRRLALFPMHHNAIIAGYIGFLNLQKLVEMDDVDAGLRETVSIELNRLLARRAAHFEKDSPFRYDEHYGLRYFNVARNFLWLVPELGSYLNQNAYAKTRAAYEEYNRVAPYWFVSRYPAEVREGVMQMLYDYPALFQAKAFIFDESYADLYKFLDAPAFTRGDLFYIQNLVALIQKAPAAAQPEGEPQDIMIWRRNWK